MSEHNLMVEIVFLLQLVAIIALGLIHRARSRTLDDIRRSTKRDMEYLRRAISNGHDDDETPPDDRPTPPPYNII